MSGYREALAGAAELAPGLSGPERRAVETALGRELPEDLADLLADVLPLGPRWPDWRAEPVAEAARSRAWVEEAVIGDVVANGWWSPALGDRPPQVGARVAAARAALTAHPALVRLRAHRFATTTAGPVLSVYTAADTIRYGDDLAGWLAREFGAPRPATAATRPAPLPFWDALFALP